ncbi:hypothetical protein HXW94_11775 [Desulfobacter latus]|uniref:Dockerin domain-containing protein n=1 Tax=Desulfobacter latus TaxID=2292 RepID=A0A850TDZ6_9BACT|nr:hypothetical protein [Desulfobacter latus]
MKIDVHDVMAVARMLTLLDPVNMNLQADVNKDNKIGCAEFNFILQRLAGQREAEPDTTQVTCATQSAIAVMDQTIEQVKSLNTVMDLIGLMDESLASVSNVNELKAAIENAADPCVTHDFSLISQAYTIDMTSCNNISGAVTLKPTYTDNNIGYTIDYDNVVVPTKNGGTCTINGTTAAAVSFTNGTISFIYQPSNLTVCGNSVNGTLAVTYNTTTQATTVSVETQTVTVYCGETADIKTDLVLTYAGADSNVIVNGNIESIITLEDGKQIHTTSLDNVEIDTSCGIPVGGEATVDGILIDFSNTTCQNPTATAYIDGTPVPVDLS